MKKNIIEIPLEQLENHPQNVRKTYEGIEELAESVRQKGILQNLTVVAKPGETDHYYIVIGNRRFLAAKMAGIQTLPCTIAEMSESEQIEVMLLENMQRNDLTPIEEAEGFQMMLEMGETVDGIAEKTGFSKPTVYSRLNIAKLDKRVLKEKQEDETFQLTLTTLKALEKLDDIKSRNTVLKQARTSQDLIQQVEIKVREKKRREKCERLVEQLETLGISKAPERVSCEIYYPHKWNVLQTISLINPIPEKIEIKPLEKGTHYYAGYSDIKIIKKVKKSASEKKFDEKKKDCSRKKKELEEIFKQMELERNDFIHDLAAGKFGKVKDSLENVSELWEFVLDSNVWISLRDGEAFVGGKLSHTQTREERERNRAKFKEWSICIQIMAMAVEDSKRMPYLNNDGSQNPVAIEKLKKFYKILEKYGLFLHNPVYIKVLDGTHELYSLQKNSAQ